MAEEFQESDVIFSDHYTIQNHGFDADNNDVHNCEEMMVVSNFNHHYEQHNVKRQKCNNKNKKKKKKMISSSVPIPNNIFQCTDTSVFEEEYDEGEIVPPHVIVGRRIAGQIAFSVCTGNGRTLKGRDLSQVRNSVLRMTGFLET